MGERFIESHYAAHIAKNTEIMANLVRFLMERRGVLVLESDAVVIGMIGYLIQPHFISGELMAGEVFWWVRPEYRGKGRMLLAEAEKRARAEGAKAMQMIAPNERVSKLYARIGYTPIETIHQKQL